ncbi:hypothetical protein [Arcanobacterium canis]
MALLSVIGQVCYVAATADDVGALDGALSEGEPVCRGADNTDEFYLVWKMLSVPDTLNRANIGFVVHSLQ